MRVMTLERKGEDETSEEFPVEVNENRVAFSFHVNLFCPMSESLINY